MKNEIKWLIDQAHSEIYFKVRHLMIAHVKGAFKTFDASIYTTEKDFSTAQVDLWIDPSSITTGDIKRDEHLIGADFFDVQNHKEITFTSNTIKRIDVEGNYELWGELTIKGISKKIKLDMQLGGIVNDPWGNEKAGITIKGKINRDEWGLSWNTIIEAGGMLVGNEVVISCEVELTNAGEKDLTMELEPATEDSIVF
jgi:polyisoprenoid-binding protein YceI